MQGWEMQRRKGRASYSKEAVKLLLESELTNDQLAKVLKIDSSELEKLGEAAPTLPKHQARTTNVWSTRTARAMSWSKEQFHEFCLRMGVDPHRALKLIRTKVQNRRGLPRRENPQTEGVCPCKSRAGANRAQRERSDCGWRFVRRAKTRFVNGTGRAGIWTGTEHGGCSPRPSSPHHNPRNPG